MLYDCIIIGGGPAGLSAAVNLSRRGKNACILSGGENLLARAERVENYLGFTGASGKELMRAFNEHAKALNIPVISGHAVNAVYYSGSFMVNTGNDIMTAKALIIACGAAKFKALPGEDRLLGKGVSYCTTCDGMFYRQKSAVVAAFSEAAASQAKFLSDIGVNVTVISAKDMPLPDNVRFIKGRLAEIEGENSVEAVKLHDGTSISCSGVFILRDSIAPDKLVPGLEIENGFIKTDRAMRTNINGIFAAGDCTGEPLQIAKAVGEGLTAALSCAEYLDGDSLALR